MRSIAVAIEKGGVGKTTTAINLAHGLALLEKKVLLVDTDTQDHVAEALKLSPLRGLGATLIDALLDQHDAPGIEQAFFEARENLFIIRAGKEMAKAEKLIASSPMAQEYALRDLFATLQHNFDYLLFDSSPGWGLMNLNVLFAANEILAPVAMEPLAINGFQKLIANLKLINQRREQGGQERIRLSYLLPTFYDLRVGKTRDLYEHLKSYPSDILCQPIRYNSKLSEQSAFGQTIFEYAPRSKGAEDYMQLAQRVVKDE